MDRISVSKDYTAAYADPISFAAGDLVDVLRADVEFPGWYWCRNPADKEGWVHQAFLSATSGTTPALRDYSARELNVRAGQRGTVIESTGGWLLVHLDDGDIGWLPATHAAALVP